MWCIGVVTGSGTVIARQRPTCFAIDRELSILLRSTRSDDYGLLSAFVGVGPLQYGCYFWYLEVVSSTCSRLRANPRKAPWPREVQKGGSPFARESEGCPLGTLTSSPFPGQEDGERGRWSQGRTGQGRLRESEQLLSRVPVHA